MVPWQSSLGPHLILVFDVLLRLLILVVSTSWWVSSERGESAGVASRTRPELGAGGRRRRRGLWVSQLQGLGKGTKVVGR